MMVWGKRMSVQQSVLGLMAAWQRTSAVNLAQAQAELKDLGQTPNQLISHLTVIAVCLHLWESRQIAAADRLKQIAQTQPYRELYRYWQNLCERSAQRLALFALPHPSVFSHSLGGLLDALLQSLLSSLYYPDPSQYAALPVNCLGQIYEQTVSLSDGRAARKSGGVYYTPAALVNYVVKATLDKFTEAPLLLDPACGGGVFLVAAYQYLLERHRLLYQRPASLSECQQLLCRIHGVDIDLMAVQVTKLSLWLTLLETAPISASVSLAVLPDLDQLIHQGNAVVADPEVDPLALDWPTVFPQVRQGFDLVLGNPPYLDAELMSSRFVSWRSYCAQHYQTATGNWDLFCVFIEKALQLCRPGGITSLVVPNKLLAANYASGARQLLSRTRLWSLRDYSQTAVFDAAVYPVVYISENTYVCGGSYVSENSQVFENNCTCEDSYVPENNCTCENSHVPENSPRSSSFTQYEQMQTLERVGLTYPIQLMKQSPLPWLVGIQAHTNLVHRLEQRPKLGDWANLTGAATVAEAYRLQELIRNQPCPDTADLRFVNSGTLDRYQMLWGQKPLRYLGQSYLHPVVAAAELGDLLPKRLHQSRQPKLIVAGMGLRIESVLDLSGSVLAGKSTTVIGLPVCNPDSGIPLDPHYLLGLLNSHLLSFYLLTRFGGNRLQGGYLRIGPPQLRQLPIAPPDSDEIYQQVVQLVQQRLQLKPDSSGDAEVNQLMQQTDWKIDQLIYALYHLKDTEIALIEEAFLAPQR
ncbi:MAG: Eco57I restriction-modification methylase domain-containing protein [Elainella sp.]